MENREELILLDAAVSEAVFGNKWVKHPRVRVNDRWWDRETWLIEGEDPEDPPAGTMVGQRPPPFSSDFNAAWRIVDWMLLKGFSFRLTEVPGWSSVQPGPLAGFAHGVHPPDDKHWWGVYEGGRTSAEAICRAAVRAIGLIQLPAATT